MRARILFCCIAGIIASSIATLSADRIRLRSGQVVDGSFMSADVKIVRLLIANGQIVEFPVDTVSAVEFSARTAPPKAPAAAPAKAPAPAAKAAAVTTPNPATAPKPVTIPNGTMLNVRLTEAVDVDVAQAGMTFKSLLDDPIMMDGRVVIPRGSPVALQVAKVEQAGKFKGSDKIVLKANSLSFAGRKYDIVTAQVEQKGSGEGKKTARKVGGGAGLGAAIGGIAGGGTGAAIGALAGAGAGAIMASSGTEHLQLPAETRLQFSLSSAVTVQP